MSKRGVSLSLLMKLVALVALDLAFLRMQSFRLRSPLFLFALVALDLVIIQAIILGRRLRPFYCAFLIVGLVVSLMLHAFVENGLFHSITRSPTSRLSPRLLVIADQCVTNVLGLLLAWVTCLWMARRPPGRLRWRIMSFCQGALIGLGVFTAVLVTLNYSGQAPVLFTSGQFACLLGFGLAVCPLLGGTAVSLLKGGGGLEGSANRS